MDSAMDRIDLYRRNDFEASLFKAQAHPPSTCEEVDPDGTSGLLLLRAWFAIRHEPTLWRPLRLVEKNPQPVEKCI